MELLRGRGPEPGLGLHSWPAQRPGREQEPGREPEREPEQGPERQQVPLLALVVERCNRAAQLVLTLRSLRVRDQGTGSTEHQSLKKDSFIYACKLLKVKSDTPGAPSSPGPPGTPCCP